MIAYAVTKEDYERLDFPEAHEDFEFIAMGWSDEEPTQPGWYWAIRDPEFSDKTEPEIVKVYASNMPPLTGMLMAFEMGTDMGLQLFEVKYWMRVAEPFVPKEMRP